MPSHPLILELPTSINFSARFPCVPTWEVIEGCALANGSSQLLLLKVVIKLGVDGLRGVRGALIRVRSIWAIMIDTNSRPVPTTISTANTTHTASIHRCFKYSRWHNSAQLHFMHTITITVYIS